MCFITAVQHLGKSCIPVRTPLLLMQRITQVTSLDTSSMLLKRFPQSGFFNSGNKSKSGGLMSGLYGGWGSIWHPYFSKISDTAPEAWGRTLSCKLRTPTANIADFFGESLDAKHLAETFYGMPLLQWTLETLYLLLSLHSCHGDHGSTVVKVLWYKSEGHWFDPSWCQWIFHWHNPSDRTMALGWTQPLTEMGTRSISWG